jgi:nitrogen regulatory protein P-II 1
MMKIEAIVREEALDPIKNALEEIGYHGMTVTQVSGRGRQGGLTLEWRAGEYKVDLLPKLKIEIVVIDDDLSRTVAAIRSAARTGEIGDGKIFVLPVYDAVRVRTGESGDDAI